jgi:hypothetical protein
MNGSVRPCFKQFLMGDFLPPEGAPAKSSQDD